MRYILFFADREDCGKSLDEAIAGAKEAARRDGRDVKVFKMIETHYIKAPVMPEPEVTEL